MLDTGHARRLAADLVDRALAAGADAADALYAGSSSTSVQMRLSELEQVTFERDAGIRIDHALLSPTLAQALKKAGVDREPRGWDKTSDHAPMWVEVAVR